MADSYASLRESRHTLPTGEYKGCPSLADLQGKISWLSDAYFKAAGDADNLMEKMAKAYDPESLRDENKRLKAANQKLAARNRPTEKNAKV